MQGITGFIPTPQKIRYLNQLLRVGFDTIDFGSFVSPAAIPQMSDTALVLEGLDMGATKSKLLAIVANTKGANAAAAFDQITYLGFPLSLSETFQLRNTKRTIAEALETLAAIKEICIVKNKKLVTYISMGFGNPYGDPYDASMVNGFVDIVKTLGSDVVSLADTIGKADEPQIRSLFSAVKVAFPDLEVGVHLHSNASTAAEKIRAAWESGCRRFDGAIKGFGGCPMAEDELVGNIPTELILSFLSSAGQDVPVNMDAFSQAMSIAAEIFPKR